MDCQNAQKSYDKILISRDFTDIFTGSTGNEPEDNNCDNTPPAHFMIFRYATVKIILAEVFVRPGAGYLWSNDFARNRIGHLNILGGFHIVLGIIDMVAPLLIRDSIGFLVYGGTTFY